MKPSRWTPCFRFVPLCLAFLAPPAPAAEVLQPQLDAEHAELWQFYQGQWQWGAGELEQLEPERMTTAILKQPALADFALAVDFNIRSAGNGARAAAVVFRATGTRTYYVLQLDSQNDNAMLLQSRPGKTWNAIARSRVSIAPDAWHTLRIECCGPEIAVTLDDQPLLKATDEALAAGRVGLGTNQGRVAFRKLRIEGDPLPDAAPLADEPLPYQIISRGGTAAAYQAFPDVCRLPGGDLVCVFYAGYAHVSLPNDAWPRGGRICLVRSSDEGRTWSQPQTLFDGEQDDRDPHIAALRDGTLACSFFQYRSVDGKIEFDTCLVASRDGGQTWDTQPRVLARRCFACSAPVRQLSDGTCLLGVYMANDSTAHGAVLRSTDGGKTWSEPIAIDPDSGVRLDAETDVVELADGSLLAALRGDKKISMHFATSRDQGRTWSSVKDIGFAGHCPHLTRLSGGEILLAHRLPRTSLHISRDQGRSWQGPTEIDSVIGAYPSTVELMDRTVLVVYYEEGLGSAIRAARFRVTADGIEMLPWK
jgi:hypothetical protein